MVSVCIVITGGLSALLPDLVSVERATLAPYIFYDGNDWRSRSADVDPSSAHMILMFSMVAALSTLPSAISFAIKEKIFRAYRLSHQNESPVEHQEPQLDVFIVNAHIAIVQLIATPLAIPINCVLGQTHGQTLGTYIRNGILCFRGVTPSSDVGCEAWGCCRHAPTAYVAYIIVNVFFNVILLMLLRTASALWGFMCLKAVLPLSVFLFLLPWPLLDSSDSQVSLWTLLALILVLLGVGLFKHSTLRKERLKEDLFDGAEPPCCFPCYKG